MSQSSVSLHAVMVSFSSLPLSAGTVLKRHRSNVDRNTFIGIVSPFKRRLGVALAATGRLGWKAIWSPYHLHWKPRTRLALQTQLHTLHTRLDECVPNGWMWLVVLKCFEWPTLKPSSRTANSLIHYNFTRDIPEESLVCTSVMARNIN